jgi:hypothetical protein
VTLRARWVTLRARWVQLNFRTRRRPAGYWDDEGVLDFELEGFVAASWTEHVEPQTDDTYFYNSVRTQIGKPNRGFI